MPTFGYFASTSGGSGGTSTANEAFMVVSGNGTVLNGAHADVNVSRLSLGTYRVWAPTWGPTGIQVSVEASANIDNANHHYEPIANGYDIIISLEDNGAVNDILVDRGFNLHIREL